MLDYFVERNEVDFIGFSNELHSMDPRDSLCLFLQLLTVYISVIE